MLWLVGLLYGVGKETLFLSFASNNCSLQGFFSLALDIDEGGIFIKRNQKKYNGKGSAGVKLVSRLRVF